MSPSNLKKLAGKIEGAKVGMEFEMYVQGASESDAQDQYDSYYEDFDWEDDFERDESVYDIDDICNFFERNGANDRNTIRRLRTFLESKFDLHLRNEAKKEWKKRGKQYLLNWIQSNVSPQQIADYLDLPEDLLGDRVPTKQDYEEVAEEEWKRPGSAPGQNYHDEAFNAFVNGVTVDNHSYDPDDEDSDQDDTIEGFDTDSVDQEEFLNENNIYMMQDIYDRAQRGADRISELNWPYRTEPLDFDDWLRNEYSGSNASDRTIKQIALSFMDGLGYDTIAYSETYHGRGMGYFKWRDGEWENVGNNKPKDCYTVEPDGSLSNDRPGEIGLEFVSPPLSLEKMSEDLENIKDWADANGGRTDRSTGLHTNISVPDYDINKLDYVKLALLSGDNYILKQFDRYGNTYASSSLDTIKSRAKSLTNDQIYTLFDQLKSNIENIASKVIHDAYSNRKMVSINTGSPMGDNSKKGYVEFRSPGNNWLDEKFSIINDTILRFVVALDAACDPNKYRKEYTKALYKMLNPKSPDDDKSLFAKYMAKDITRAEFIRQIEKRRKNRQTNDELASILSGENDPQGLLDEPSEGETRYRFSTRDGSVGHSYEIGTDPMDAYNRLISRSYVWRTMPTSNVIVDQVDQVRQTEPSRPVSLPNATGPDSRAVQELINRYRDWCEQQGLPLVNPEDQDFEELNDNQREWLMRFNEAWSSVHSGRIYRVTNLRNRDTIQVYAHGTGDAIARARVLNSDFRDLYHNDISVEPVGTSASVTDVMQSNPSRENPAGQENTLTQRNYRISDTAGTIHPLTIPATSADEARRIARLRYPELDSLGDDRLIAMAER